MFIFLYHHFIINTFVYNSYFKLYLKFNIIFSPNREGLNPSVYNMKNVIRVSTECLEIYQMNNPYQRLSYFCNLLSTLLT